jgi:hypothetical protein
VSVTALAIGVLGVWRITHLLHAENGPWNVMLRFRELISASFWSNLLGCFYCLSLWVAVPFAGLLAGDTMQRLLLWPALSAGAILIERLTSSEITSGQAVYLEDEEKPNVRMYTENVDTYASDGSRTDTNNKQSPYQ